MPVNEDYVARLIERFALSGKKLFVILSADGSTVVRDPGMNQPWASTNEGLARFHADELQRSTGKKHEAVPIAEAIKYVIRHPKNQPRYKFQG